MKKGVRILAVGTGPAEGRGRTMLVGLVFRGGIVEGVIAGRVAIDGTDATSRIASMLSRSRFRGQVKIIALNGIGIAGLNIVDIQKLGKATGTGVISVTRHKPHPEKLIAALVAFGKMEHVDVEKRIEIVKQIEAMGVIRAGGFYAQTTMSKTDAGGFVEGCVAQLRLVHMIARAVSTGESVGRI